MRSFLSIASLIFVYCVISTLNEKVEACSCQPIHPQAQFCRSHYGMLNDGLYARSAIGLSYTFICYLYSCKGSRSNVSACESATWWNIQESTTWRYGNCRCARNWWRGEKLIFCSVNYAYVSVCSSFKLFQKQEGNNTTNSTDDDNNEPTSEDEFTSFVDETSERNEGERVRHLMENPIHKGPVTRSVYSFACIIKIHHCFLIDGAGIHPKYFAASFRQGCRAASASKPTIGH